MSRNGKKPMAAGFKRLFTSGHGKAVFPRAMKDELQFEAFLPFVSLQADDKTILTRGGELIQCIRVDGLNSMTASDRDIALLKETVAELLAQQGERSPVATRARAVGWLKNRAGYLAFSRRSGSEKLCGGCGSGRERG